MFGIDWEGRPVQDDGDAVVNVPDTLCPLLPRELALLQTLVDPLQPCDDFGITMYGATREFVTDVLSQRQVLF